MSNRAIVRTYILPGEFRLLVGRDVEERMRIRDIIRRAFGWSLLLVGVLGCFGGWFVTRRVLKRVDAMTDTTRTMLLEHVWDYHFDPQTNVIDVHVSRLRSKIDKGFGHPLIHTVRGAGYIVRAGGEERET